jgi:hypothetical protein
MTDKELERDTMDFSASADSVTLTQYSSEASRLIRSFTKNIPFVVVILILIVSLTTLDLVMDLGFTRILADETIDAIIIAVSSFLILFTLLLVRPVLRSQKILVKWSNLFENNSIRTGLILTIKNKSKEEILSALPGIITQIANPLDDYLSKSDKKEFYNVSKDGFTTFDILIDNSTIKSMDSDSLKDAIQEYGGILIKIVDKVIDKSITEDFLKSLQKYQKRDKIGLAIIIGESISEESYVLVNRIKDKSIGDNLILVEKPNRNKDYDLKNLENVLT